MRKRFFFPKRDSDGRNGLLSFFFSLFLFTIPSPKLVTLQGLLEVYRVVVYHNDNAKPTGSPRWTF